jgi:hypothetical protein
VVPEQSVYSGELGLNGAMLAAGGTVMARVLGVGGVFFKAADQAALVD